jgi:hypothetical protein
VQFGNLALVFRSGNLIRNVHDFNGDFSPVNLAVGVRFTPTSFLMHSKHTAIMDGGPLVIV